jgi:uncharacterized membrane protein YfcA
MYICIMYCKCIAPPHPLPQASSAAAAAMRVQTFPKTFLIGFASGAGGSLLGIGGSIFCVPLLVRFLGLRQVSAQGNATAVVFCTAAGSSYAYSKIGDLNWWDALYIGLPGFFTSVIAARMVRNVPQSAMKAAFGVLTLSVAVSMLSSSIKPRIPNDEELEEKIEVVTNSTSTRSSHSSRLATIGAIGGVLSGSFGVGGGIFTVPALSMFCDKTHLQSVATSLGAMILPALGASGTHLWQGTLLPRVALPLSGGALIGAWVSGSFLAPHLEEKHLKLVFGGFLGILGAHSIRKALPQIRQYLASGRRSH